MSKKVKEVSEAGPRHRSSFGLRVSEGSLGPRLVSHPGLADKADQSALEKLAEEKIGAVASESASLLTLARLTR